METKTSTAIRPNISNKELKSETIIVDGKQIKNEEIKNEPFQNIENNQIKEKNKSVKMIDNDGFITINKLKDEDIIQKEIKINDINESNKNNERIKINFMDIPDINKRCKTIEEYNGGNNSKIFGK